MDQGKVPATLAAVRLADDNVLLGEALTWVSRLGLDTGNTHRSAGILGSDGG